MCSQFYDRVSPLAAAAPEGPAALDEALSERHRGRVLLSEERGEALSGLDALRDRFVKHIRPRSITTVLANDRASLLYLANLGCIDQNPWMSRVGSLDHPDWMLLDLDPVEASFDLIVEAALLMREVLDELGLKGYPKTTGGDGMHVYVPLEPIYTYEQVRSFAEIVSHLALDQRAESVYHAAQRGEAQKGPRLFRLSADWDGQNDCRSLCDPCA